MTNDQGPMTNLSVLREHYARLLELGFVVLRQAIDAKDWEWADKERDLLHNLPSLMYEPNVKRHECWLIQRRLYIEWVNRRGEEPRSRMLTYYAPFWEEMEPDLKEFLSSTVLH